MLSVEMRFIPFDSPASSEMQAMILTTRMIDNCNPILTGIPNTWCSPVLICATPRPSDWETPKAVMTTPMISTTWPIQP
ncbi:hypothetical protein D3C76_1579990 [compost metagenome]